MLHAHGRAKVHRAVRGPWPARIKPLENETLSSWLVRASLANFSSPSTVVNYIWPGWRAWTRDIDRELTPEQLKALQQVSSLSANEIDSMLLKPVIMRLNQEAKLNRTNTWPWVIQRSTRNKNTIRSTQFCPLCLIQDVKPYLRRQWRISFITICTKHRINLHDSCPHCGASIEVHKLTRGKLKQCAHCRWDMSDIKPASANNELASVTDILERQAFGDQGYSTTLFQRLRYLISLVRKLSAQQSIPQSTSRLFQCNEERFYAFADFSSLAFDWLTTDDRRSLLETVAPLMSMGAAQFALSLLESDIPLSLLNNCADTIPEELQQYLPEKRCFDARARNETQNPVKKLPSRRAIERRWQAFLVKHGID